jgi:hypothetical protein
MRRRDTVMNDGAVRVITTLDELVDQARVSLGG